MQDNLKTKMCKNIEPGCKLLFDPLISMGCKKNWFLQSYVYKQHLTLPETNGFNTPEIGFRWKTT